MQEGPKYLVESANDQPEVFDTLEEARAAFDSSAEAQADESSDGWSEEAEYLPRLSVCYLLARHGLTNRRTIEQVEADGDEYLADIMRGNGWDFFAEGKVTEHPDPIAALTAERDAALAERDALRAEVTEALGFLEGGRLYREDGTEIPTTIVDRARWHGVALGAERAETYRLRAELTTIIRNVTQGRRSGRAPRWAHLKEVGAHGSTLSAEMVRLAGLDPNEVTGWPGSGPCPLCGVDLDDDGGGGR